MATTMEKGTADFVTELTYTRQVKRYGFSAYLIDRGDRDAIYLSCGQGAFCLYGGIDGYDEWLKLLLESPEIAGKMRFVGAAGASRSPKSQWHTHGPSDLLGRD